MRIIDTSTLLGSRFLKDTNKFRAKGFLPQRSMESKGFGEVRGS